MKYILVFGAGKIYTSLIDYLVKEAPSNNWFITVAASTPVTNLPIDSTIIKTVVTNPKSEAKRRLLIAEADLVITLLSPALNLLVATDCAQLKKHLITPTYKSEEM